MVKDKAKSKPKTMHQEYGDGSQDTCCQECGYCITCGDCKRFGCGKNIHSPSGQVKRSPTKRWRW